MTTTTEQTESITIHPWEKAGLGKAPFRWVGVSIEVGPKDLGNGMTSGAPGQPMGCCAYCFQGIKEVHRILSADGKRFTVGCDCVRRCYAKGERVLSDVEAAARKLARRARHAREAAKLAEGRDFLSREDVVSVLRSLPHPNSERAARGETFASMVEWYMDRAGTAGKLKIISQARKAIAAAKKVL